MLRAFGKKTLRHRPAGSGGVLQIGVQPVNQLWAHFGVRLARHEAPDARLLEQVIATKDFIGAFARQHHLEAGLAHAAGQQHHGRGRGAHDGALRVHDGLRKSLRDVGTFAAQGAVLGAQVRHQLVLVAALVELFVFKGQ